MLSSSDAKFRCLWHLCVWSVVLTLVSQFLNVIDHIAFYIFGFLSVILLPVITSIYCNSSGKKGVRLLRVSYVLADPVLSCLTITPVLLMQHLPETLDQFYCLNAFTGWNKTLQCFHNQSVPVLSAKDGHRGAMQLTKFRILVIQACLLAPVLVSVLMGRKTTKMAYTTGFLNSGYWMIVAIEAASLVETALVDHRYIHMVFTTEITVSIVMVIANSYGLVTLVSFISPVSASLRRKYNTKFDFVFKVIVVIAAIFLAEVPFTVARFQIFILDRSVQLPGTFFLWAIKDLFFIVMILLVLGVKRLGETYKRTCAPITKNRVYFQPEKRDVYRAKRVHFEAQHHDTASITGSYQFVMKNGKFSLVKKVVDAGDGLEQKKPCSLSTVHEEDETSNHPLDKVDKALNMPSTSKNNPEPLQSIYDRYNLNRQKELEKSMALGSFNEQTPVSSVESLDVIYDKELKQSGALGALNEQTPASSFESLDGVYEEEFKKSGALGSLNEQTPVSSVESLDGICGSTDHTYRGSKDIIGPGSEVVFATVEKPEYMEYLQEKEDPNDMEVRMINQPSLPHLLHSAHL